MPSEKEMIEEVFSSKFSLAPLTFRLIQFNPKVDSNRHFDALVEVSWKNITAKFVVEFKSLSTPMVFQNTLNMLKSLSLQNDCLPMLVMPYLSESQLQELEREGISGIDLCGNGVVIAPRKFSVLRSGKKNRFPSSALIKNVYRKNSSMAGRVFLSKGNYETVQKICDEVNRRNLLVNSWNKNPMSLSTVSKVLKTLEDDLIVERKKSIQLLQPDKLLEKLSENYSRVNTKMEIQMKILDNKESVTQMLSRISRSTGLPIVATGISSVTRYAVMQRGEMLSVYCPRIEKILELIPGRQSDRFPNLELIQTDDETVYFDASEQENFRWASPIQVYLELIAGDKRDQETAEQVKSFILHNVKQEQQG
ncbi:MAG: winged helix-turn-helix domain-containing protein [Candidatus Latescibacteria bacterium]|nr:winged helix-turn-helix domain-containing protein [Candidatus Latescibacterota bacterium]